MSVSYTKPEIHVYGMADAKLRQKWVGILQERFVLRMATGGPYGEFTAIGSENGEVLYFHISHQLPVARFVASKNHSVNCVSWIDANRLVECNDDRSVQIWVCGNEHTEVKILKRE